MSFFNNVFPEKPKEFRGQTLKWVGSDHFRNFQKYQPNPYTENDITYKYNEYGFRSDNFINSKYRLVFLGCSITEGIGLPLEETFSHLIYTQIKKEIGEDFPYWNLGLEGCGLDSITRCYYNFYKQLKPHVVIVLFPSYRLEYFHQNWKSILVNDDIDNVFYKNPHLIDPNVITYNIEKNLAILDLLLEKTNTALIWDRWDGFDNVNTSKLETFKNYADSWQIAFSKTKNSNLARDGKHPGKKTNEEFANMLLNKYHDMICRHLINGAP